MVEREFLGPSAMRSIDDENLEPWIEAFMAIDGPRRETTPLIQLLRDNVPMPWPAPWHLADLLARYNLKKPPGNQKQVPSYDYSDAWAKLHSRQKIFRTLPIQPNGQRRRDQKSRENMRRESNNAS